MPPVELTQGNQVEAGDEHPDPSREGRGAEVNGRRPREDGISEPSGQERLPEE